MMREEPSYDFFQPPDEPEHSEVAISRPKATFQWPPDCMWPFMDHGGESKT